MTNKVWLVQNIIDEINRRIKASDYTKEELILPLLNDLVINVLSETFWWFNKTKYVLVVESGVETYRFPSDLTNIKYAFPRGQNLQLKMMPENEARTLVDNNIYTTSAQYIGWFGQSTCLQKDLTTKGGLIKVVSDSALDTTNVTITGIVGTTAVSDTITLNGITEVSSVEYFTEIYSITKSATNGTISILNSQDDSAVSTFSTSTLTSDIYKKIKATGTQISVKKSDITIATDVFISGYLDGIRREETITLSATDNTYNSSTYYYDDIENISVLTEGHYQITVKDAVADDIVLTIETFQDTYYAKLLHIYPNDNAIIDMIIDKKPKTYTDSTQVFTSIPNEYIYGIIVEGLLMRIAIYDESKTAVRQDAELAFNNTLRRMKEENNRKFRGRLTFQSDIYFKDEYRFNIL